MSPPQRNSRRAIGLPLFAVMDETEPRWFFANLVRVRLSQQVAGQMSVVEFAAPPGDMPPLHLHLKDDEAWYVLEGEMSFFVGDNEPKRIAAGAIAFGPKGVPHTYRVEGAATHAGSPSARRVTSSTLSLRQADQPIGKRFRLPATPRASKRSSRSPRSRRSIGSSFSDRLALFLSRRQHKLEIDKAAFRTLGICAILCAATGVRAFVSASQDRSEKLERI